MPTEASLQDLKKTYDRIKHNLKLHEGFFIKAIGILDYARTVNIRFRVVCKMFIDEEYKEEKPVSFKVCLLSDFNNMLREKTEAERRYIYKHIMQLRKEYFDEYNEFADFLRENRWTGYDNICRMLLGETPEQVFVYGKYTARGGVQVE